MPLHEPSHDALVSCDDAAIEIYLSDIDKVILSECVQQRLDRVFHEGQGLTVCAATSEDREQDRVSSQRSLTGQQVEKAILKNNC